VLHVHRSERTDALVEPLAALLAAAPVHRVRRHGHSPKSSQVTGTAAGA
jgi:hypothetical protein